MRCQSSKNRLGPAGMWLKEVPRAYVFWSAAGPQPCLLPTLSSCSVKVAEWRRSHTKTPSGNNSEGRAGKENQPLFFLQEQAVLWLRVGLWRHTVLWYSSCTDGRLFQAERGDGYYESGVAAFSIPERCLGTQPWMPSNEKEISILPGATAARQEELLSSFRGKLGDAVASHSQVALEGSCQK